MLSAGILKHVSAADFAACAKSDTSYFAKSAVEVLSGIVDLNITLATTLIGLGAALIIGLNNQVRVTPLVSLLVLSAIVAFSQSVVYALWWKTRVAFSWFSECPTLLSSAFVQRPYSWHIYFFVAGLVLLGVMVCSVIADQSPKNGRAAE